MESSTAHDTRDGHVAGKDVWKDGVECNHGAYHDGGATAGTWLAKMCGRMEPSATYDTRDGGAMAGAYLANRCGRMEWKIIAVVSSPFLSATIQNYTKHDSARTCEFGTGQSTLGTRGNAVT